MPNETTARALLKERTAYLLSAGTEGAKEAAEQLFCKVLGVKWHSPAYFAALQQSLSAEQAAAFTELTEKRKENVPLQYLLGEWEFMGQRLYTGEGVLIPRDDTEVLCRTAADFVKKAARPLVGVDLCAGTGAVGIGLCAAVPAGYIQKLQCVELYEDALTYLQKNLALYPQFPLLAVRGDVLDEAAPLRILSEPVDFLTANPPYIRRTLLPKLARELTYEPFTSLCGGEDGLQFYRAIAKNWLPRVKKGGFVVFEMGEEQAEAVREIVCAAASVENFTVHKDLSGLDRAVSFTMG